MPTCSLKTFTSVRIYLGLYIFNNVWYPDFGRSNWLFRDVLYILWCILSFLKEIKVLSCKNINKFNGIDFITIQLWWYVQSKKKQHKDDVLFKNIYIYNGRNVVIKWKYKWKWCEKKKKSDVRKTWFLWGVKPVGKIV